MEEKLFDILIDRIDDLSKKQDKHREEFLREITEIKTRYTVNASIRGGLWGLVSASIVFVINKIFN